MPISYKNKIYTTLGTPTNITTTLTPLSVSNSSGVPVKDYTVKGKSIVWNQLVRNGNFVDKTGWAPDNGKGSVSNNKYTFTVTGTQAYSNIIQYMDKSLFIVGHKYYITATITPQYSTGRLTVALHNGATIQQTLWTATASSGKTNFVSTTFTISRDFVSGATGSIRLVLYCPQTESAQGDVTEISNVWMVDLTKMFGAGNEPTAAQFRAMFPDDYYEYDAGTIKSIVGDLQLQSSLPERYQLADKSKFQNISSLYGISVTNNNDGSIMFDGTKTTSDTVYFSCGTYQITENHKYYLYGAPAGGGDTTYALYTVFTPTGGSNVYGFDIGNGVFFSGQANASGQGNIKISIVQNTVSNLIFTPQLFDLTAMFGAGNEPTTPAEFWQKVTKKYYPYNPNAYKSVNIPVETYFPDGMKSAGVDYDEISFSAKTATRRIESIDLGTVNWIYESDYQGLPAFRSQTLPGVKTGIDWRIQHIFCSKYSFDWTVFAPTPKDKTCGLASAGQIYVRDSSYSDAATFKAAMSGVILNYPLATPVVTNIPKKLQALPTYKGFTSFSAPNSLTQSGPFDLTYYAEGGTNPEKGFLTSYKRKIYMGRTIEWNQLFTNSITFSNGVTISQNSDGTLTLNGTSTSAFVNFSGLSDAMNQVHKYLIWLKILNNPDSVPISYGWLNRDHKTRAISRGKTYVAFNQTAVEVTRGNTTGIDGFAVRTVFNNVKIAVMVFDLTKMFGAGNEPTAAQFWQYFDNKYYPYNTGETQPLFKISRKRRWGGVT